LALVLLRQLAEGLAVALFGGEDEAEFDGGLCRKFLCGTGLRI